jgi:hypothetical protein
VQDPLSLFNQVLTAYAGDATDALEWQSVAAVLADPADSDNFFVGALLNHLVHGAVILAGARSAVARTARHVEMWAVGKPRADAFCACMTTEPPNLVDALVHLTTFDEFWVSVKDEDADFAMSGIWKTHGRSVQDTQPHQPSPMGGSSPWCKSVGNTLIVTSRVRAGSWLVTVGTPWTTTCGTWLVPRVSNHECDLDSPGRTGGRDPDLELAAS